MAFDAMAAGIDWLDAYRAKDLDAITAMYAVDAMIECGCGGEKTIAGEASLRSYWRQRFEKYPATDLEDIRTMGDRLDIAYRTTNGVVAAVMEFDDIGKIVRVRSAPDAGDRASTLSTASCQRA